MVLGVGNLLYSDDGFGIVVVEKLLERYDFPEHVSVVDGGVLGVNLLGVISHAHHLIVVDTIKNNGRPGDIHCLRGDQIPSRILSKNSLHQVDLLEALTLCLALDHVPKTVILGPEPQDIETLRPELTPVLANVVNDVIERVLDELESLGAPVLLRP